MLRMATGRLLTTEQVAALPRDAIVSSGRSRAVARNPSPADDSTAVTRILETLTTQRPPVSDRPFFVPEQVRWYHRQRLRFQTWRACGRQCVAPIDPTATLEIPPEAITHTLDPSWRRRLEASTPGHVQAVTGGDWDRTGTRFLESTPYRTVADVLGAQREIELDEADKLEAPAEGSIARLEWLLADIATGGYRSVAERRNRRRDPTEPSILDPHPQLPPAKSEVRVTVGRDGRLLVHSGHGRLAVARLLGVRSIPVHVYVRHERWQRRRDRVVLTGSGRGSHPDLACLEP